MPGTKEGARRPRCTHYPRGGVISERGRKQESPLPCDCVRTNAAGPQGFVGHRMHVCTVVRVFQCKSKRKPSGKSEGSFMVNIWAHLRDQTVRSPQSVTHGLSPPLGSCIPVSRSWLAHAASIVILHQCNLVGRLFDGRCGGGCQLLLCCTCARDRVLCRQRACVVGRARARAETCVCVCFGL